MGLDLVLLVPKDEIETGYHTFNHLRECIADVAGVILPPDTIEKPTKKQAGSPFWELLNHPDDDGMLTWSQCEELSKDFAEYKEAFAAKYPDLVEDYEELSALVSYCAAEEGILDFR